MLVQGSATLTLTQGSPALLLAQGRATLLLAWELLATTACVSVNKVKGWRAKFRVWALLCPWLQLRAAQALHRPQSCTGEALSWRVLQASTQEVALQASRLGAEAEGPSEREEEKVEEALWATRRSYSRKHGRSPRLNLPRVLKHHWAQEYQGELPSRYPSAHLPRLPCCLRCYPVPRLAQGGRVQASAQGHRLRCHTKPRPCPQKAHMPQLCRLQRQQSSALRGPQKMIARPLPALPECILDLQQPRPRRTSCAGLPGPSIAQQENSRRAQE